ncbi:MAG TPA: insulinase family protein [Syntrophales bacterium]|nr:insulinase family protein [Syntrophales bacterium]
MSDQNSSPAPVLATGDIHEGFRVHRVEPVEDIRVTAYLMEHEKTGARVLHLHSRDRENLIAVAFPTPPADSTGLPHILEHSVLAGSRTYPVKDAFNELMKGSLQTFINAFTYPDKTVYPVASQTPADFYNLARVYADLVFHPRLLPETFRQEGHHLEPADPDNPAGGLTVSGIVFNEMKGAYSSPESLLYKAIQENLYPATPYVHDSGGSPDVIPSLTYEQFRAFHRARYAPSNAFFFLYGDIPPQEHLAFLKTILEDAERTEAAEEIPGQERWTEPRSVRAFYPVGKDEPRERKTTVNIAWMLSDSRDSETAVLLEIVAGILVGSAAGPLRKALVDSGLGEDLSPVTGMERDLKQTFFSTGLRGTDPEKAAGIEKLILETLETETEKGFDRELIEGTLHQVEFHGREIKRKTYPYGITLMGRAFHGWLYGGDPLAGLNFPAIISGIRRRWEADPRLFEKTARTWLIENPHRLLAVLEPSATVQEERESAFRERMERLRAALSDGDMERIRREAEDLRRYQSEPDPPEAAATLPRLKVADIPAEPEFIPTEDSLLSGVPTLRHDLYTNGIAYWSLAFDISDVPEDLQPLLPLLGKLTLNMGAASRSYEEMAKRIALKTGGLRFSLSAGFGRKGEGTWQKLIVEGKSLYRNVPDALAILKDLLLAGDLDDRTRMRDLILEKKNRLQAAVIPSGHSFAKMAAAASLSLPAWRDEQWHGRSQLRFAARTAESLEKEAERLQGTLAGLKTAVFRRAGLTVDLAADREGLAILSAELGALITDLPAGKASAPFETALKPSRPGVAIPADVNYVARVLPAPVHGDPQAAALLVLARYLSSGYLYKRIRVQGGAYGGMCGYDSMNGLFSLLSYRDPHLVETLDVYDGVPDEIRRGIDPEELEKAVIGTIGLLDRPTDPSGKAHTALIRRIAGVTDDDRRALRRRILDMTPETLQAAAEEFLAESMDRSSVAVFAPEEKLRKANESLREALEVEPLVQAKA